jgi:hypothetical protein
LFRHPYINFAGFKKAIKYPVSLLRLFKQRWLRKKQHPPVSPWEFPYFEDIFWGSYIPHFFRWFKVGSIPDAISFAFEVNPRVLYRLNSNQLPMGVHAWEKYDINFWKPFIEKEGYKLNEII